MLEVMPLLLLEVAAASPMVELLELAPELILVPLLVDALEDMVMLPEGVPVLVVLLKLASTLLVVLLDVAVAVKDDPERVVSGAEEVLLMLLSLALALLLPWLLAADELGEAMELETESTLLVAMLEVMPLVLELAVRSLLVEVLEPMAELVPVPVLVDVLGLMAMLLEAVSVAVLLELGPTPVVLLPGVAVEDADSTVLRVEEVLLPLLSVVAEINDDPVPVAVVLPVLLELVAVEVPWPMPVEVVGDTEDVATDVALLPVLLITEEDSVLAVIELMLELVLPLDVTPVMVAVELVTVPVLLPLLLELLEVDVPVMNVVEPG